jgi:hypothetical protein
VGAIFTLFLTLLVSAVTVAGLAVMAAHSTERAHMHEAFVADMADRLCLQKDERTWECPVVEGGLPNYVTVTEP